MDNISFVLLQTLFAIYNTEYVYNVCSERMSTNYITIKQTCSQYMFSQFIRCFTCKMMKSILKYEFLGSSAGCGIVGIVYLKDIHSITWFCLFLYICMYSLLTTPPPRHRHRHNAHSKAKTNLGIGPGGTRWVYFVPNFIL